MKWGDDSEKGEALETETELSARHGDEIAAHKYFRCYTGTGEKVLKGTGSSFYDQVYVGGFHGMPFFRS
jgi:hypothetical protein